MPNLMTMTGMLQLTGMGLALLLIFFLRARRYGGSIMPLYAVLWIAICIGAAVHSVVELQHDIMAIVHNVLGGALIPVMAASGLQAWLRKQRKRRLIR